MKVFFLTMMIFASQLLLAQGEDSSTQEPEKIVSGDTTIVRLGKHQLKIVEREGKDEILLEKLQEDEWITRKSWTDGEKDEDCFESKFAEWHRKNKLTHWSGIYVGSNGYIGNNQSIELPEGLSLLEVDYSQSFMFALNFPEIKLRLIKDYVGIYTGLGYQFHSYRMRQNTHIGFGNEMSFEIDSLRALTRNTVQAGYLRAPIMLEFNTSLNPAKTVHFAVGVVGGFLLHSTYVQNYHEAGVDYTLNSQRIPNLNPFTAEVMVRAGYGPFVLFASYGLTPMFRRSEGPELFPINAGIGFAF